MSDDLRNVMTLIEMGEWDDAERAFALLDERRENPPFPPHEPIRLDVYDPDPPTK